MKKIITKMPPKINRSNGSIVGYLVKCKRDKCKCLRGELHGPYYYRFWRENGRKFKEYIPKAEVSTILAANIDFQERKLREKKIQKHHLAVWRNLKAQFKEIITNE